MTRKQKKVAVVGGGVFGTTSAIILAESGHEVTLFEAASDIFTAASGINQYRMHLGYHYPRSADTIKSCTKSTPQFEEYYSDAIISHYNHYYAIAKQKSFLAGQDYIKTLDSHGLPYEIVEPEHINHAEVDVVVKVNENVYDPYLLKEIIKERLEKSGVTLKLNSEVTINDLDDFDTVVVATYARLNEALAGRPEMQREYQYEVCEKIVISIPDELKNISTVIMDGPFMSFDPLGNTGFAVMGHVEHAIHRRSFGSEASIPDNVRAMLNKGIIKNPDVSSYEKFLETGAQFMPGLKDAKYEGSMFTVRTVLPRVDDTDTRPTVVNMMDNRIITIYSGKVGNSVQAANEVLALINHG